MIIKVSDLKPHMSVIYKINYPNKKIYIGFTTDLQRRMYEHNNPCKNKKRQICDLAIIKYGKITEVEILEFIIDYSRLEEREKYWINYYNSTNKKIGYNITDGGDASGQINENHYNSVFSNSEVLDIRKRRYSGERKKDVYKDYSDKSFSTFENIWLGKGYPSIGKEYIIEKYSKTRQEYSHEANIGIKNGRAKFNKEQIKEIRYRYEKGESISSINKDFNVSYSTIFRIVNKQVFKEIE